MEIRFKGLQHHSEKIRTQQRRLSVDLAVPQQLHWSGTDTTETPVSRLSCTTAVTLVRYGHNRDACQSTWLYHSSYTGQVRTQQRRLSVDLAVPQQLHWSGTDTTETPVSRLSCTTAVTLVRYGHNRDTCQLT